MEIVGTLFERKEMLPHLRSIKDEKVVGTIDACGSIHEGHLKLFEDCKKECDFLVIEYSRFWSGALVYFRQKTTSVKAVSFQTFVSQLEPVKDIVDYVIYSPMDSNLWEYTYRMEKYRNDFFNFLNDLGIPSSVPQCLAYDIHSDVVDSCTVGFHGSKNIIMDLAFRKLLPENVRRYDPKMIWKIYRDPKTSSSIYRTSTNPTLGRMIKEVHNEILSGSCSIKKVEEITKSMFLGSVSEKPEFSIIDLTTVEKLDELSNNCVVVVGDGWKQEFVFVKNGEVIF